MKNYGTASRYFHKQVYDKAREIFEKLAVSSPAEVAERARVHLRLCEQKLKRPAMAPKTAIDNYNLGVAELNARNLEKAIEFLSKADRAAPNREEIRYALAAAHVLQGNHDAALEHLKVAIELRPENRYQARQDEDFQALAKDLRFRRLTQPEARSTS